MDNIHKFCHLEHINKHFLFVQFLFFPFISFSGTHRPSYINWRRCEQRNILQTNKFLVCWIENVHEHAWSKCVLCRFLCFDWDAGCVFFHIMIISCSARLIRSYFTLLLFHTLFSLVSTACFHLCMCMCVCQFECVLFNFKNSATLLPEQHRFNSEPTLQQTHHIEWIDRVSPLYEIEHNIHFLT